MATKTAHRIMFILSAHPVQMAYPLQNDSFHLLVRTIVKEEDGVSHSVNPSRLVLYYRGGVQDDGTHFALHTPLGLLSSESIPNWELGGLRMGNGVSFKPTAIEISAGSVRLSLGFDKPSSVLEPLRGPVIDQGLPLELLVWGKALSMDYARHLPGRYRDDPDDQLRLERLCGIKAVAEQEVQLGVGQRYLLLGSCRPGRLFVPRTDMLFPETFRTIFTDLEALRRGLASPTVPERTAAGERPLKTPKREPVVKEEDENNTLLGVRVKQERPSD